jgi:hypothetical protein
MSGASKTCPLSSALLALLPGAGVRSRKATGWHSATFAGVWKASSATNGPRILHKRCQKRNSAFAVNWSPT